MEPLWLAAGFMVVSAIAISRTRIWPLELFSHFRPHLIAAGAVMIAIFMAGQWLASVALVSVAVVANAVTFPKIRCLLPSPQSDPGLCVLWGNLWKRERALERTIAYARAKGAEVLLFAEFPDVDAQRISELAPDYPHTVISEFSHARFTSRVAILSKAPFERSETLKAPPLQKRPMQSVWIRRGEKLLQLSAVHPAAPGTPQMLRDRDVAMGVIFAAQSDPALVGGDFNATPWCEAMREAPTRIGNPLRESTWLTRLPLIGLPIDHFFVTSSVRVSAYKVGPFLGSDHRALLARVHV